jgi:hypothetical protein
VTAGTLRPEGDRAPGAGTPAARRRLVLAATALAALAELGHLAALWQEYPFMPVLGYFHLAVSALYGLLLATLVTDADRVRARAGAVLAGGTAVLFVLSRTLGIPAVLTFWRLEVTPVGVLTTLVEIGLVAVLVLLHRRPPPPPAAAATGAATGAGTVDEAGGTAGGATAARPDRAGRSLLARRPRLRRVLGAAVVLLGLTNLFPVLWIPLGDYLADPSIAPTPVREVSILLVVLGLTLLLPRRRRQR